MLFFLIAWTIRSIPRQGISQISGAESRAKPADQLMQFQLLSGVKKPALRPEELPPTMFLSISTTLNPFL